MNIVTRPARAPSATFSRRIGGELLAAPKSAPKMDSRPRSDSCSPIDVCSEGSCRSGLSDEGGIDDDAAATMTRSLPCDVCERLYSSGGGGGGAPKAEPEERCDPTRRPRYRQRSSLDRADGAFAVECGRCSADEGRWSRCASSVVRWDGVDGMFSRQKLIWIVVALLLSLALPCTAEPPRFSAGTPAATTVAPSTKVCQSIDIRNSVSHFSRLEGCRIVEGFVQILLIDYATDAAYANITFPDLVEITGYLMLYRVNGLRSIGRLFPNLTVIRGHSLFINYALVAFEMMHLQEIGLHSLTDILRGSVRFEKNPALCYVDTIDWDLIAKNGMGEHVISGNKPKNGCPVCEKGCPQRLTKPDEILCWNRKYCQRTCKNCGARACRPSGECCHESCLGGCTGPSAQNCIACKDVVVGGNSCVQRCPDGTFKFLNRRCIQENECRNMRKPLEAFDIVKEYPYKPFNNSCIIECPAGYMDEEIKGKSSCKKCNGACLKECAGASVDSIASAQKLRGCTHITGSLEIQIRGGKNIVKELEDSLSMIEVIDGYLKIVRSFPLISLNFLKSLRIIKGMYLDNGKYSLAVLDNQNLQELWDWDTHAPIKIMAKENPVKVFFHFNPKLCLQKIEKLREVARLPEFTELEVASNSNGDKMACNVTLIVTRVTKKTHNAALIEWPAFRHHDSRSLLGYVVYFIEAPNKNVTMYDGRDACGGDGWRVDDVSSTEVDGIVSVVNGVNATIAVSYVSHILTQLKPYTQYAYYVKTYTIATERSGAQSEVSYFITQPTAPSAPRALSTWSNASSELVVSWFPPLHNNGNLTHYRIVGRLEPDDPSFLAQRNYCDEPMSLPEKKPVSVLAEEERKKAEKEKELANNLPERPSCDCADRQSDQTQREKEVSSSIAFEDALHNQVYVKRHNDRRRRDVAHVAVPREKGSRAGLRLANSSRGNYSYDSFGNKTTTKKELSHDNMQDGVYTVFERLIPSTNLSVVVRNLRHFAVYNIEVEACRELVKDDDPTKKCSTKSMRTYRTLPLDNADDIPSNSFRLEVGGNNSFTTVKLQWAEPASPNGLIVTYQIEYKRVGIQNIKATVVCITKRDFTNSGSSYVLKELASGNYSVRVRATSLAGNGAYTELRYFYIPEYSTGGMWTAFWVVIGIFLLLLPFLVFFFVCRRKSMRNVPSMRLIATVNPEYVSTVYVPDEWEVPRKKIQLIKELGNGSFGMVYEGIAKDVVKGQPEVQCAVKTVNENATDRERIEFLNEASVMKAFNTHHVVRLLGVVSQGQPTLVVMELMVNGDLKSYLRSHRPDVCENFSRQPPTLKRILQMAIEIADGMSYLAAKKFVHRDLAARNCMVADDLTVKIGDFGMTRDIYETDYYRKGTKGLLPVRWMAPESLKDGVFTSYSDVWSYGVVLWEMVTLASQPYQGLSNDQVLRYVIDGGVMERPENCPDSLYAMMRRTWNHKPTKRPTFIDISTMLLQDVDVESFERVSFYHSSEGIEARNQNSSHSPQADKDLEIATLRDLHEDDAEGEEDSPLRQDFGDFANFEPASMKINSKINSKYGPESYGENSKMSSNFHDLNSSKVPLKADFDDFDGALTESLSSSKDTLNLPFAEDSLKSVKNSPFVEKRGASQRNSSQSSAGKSLSPQSMANPIVLESPSLSKQRGTPDYENRSPELLYKSADKNAIPLSLDFSSIETIDDVDEADTERGKRKPQAEYVNKPETLNNGYIGGTTT